MTSWLANPWALWLLLLLPTLVSLAVLAWLRRRRALTLLGNGLALYRLVPLRRGPRLLRGVCLGLGLLALLLGIAGPQWGHGQAETAPGRDLVVVLDLSRSMLAEQPSRQERALRALADLCETVQRRGGHRLALVVFAARARLACPLTHDYDHFRDALGQQDAASVPPGLRPTSDDAVSGTRIGAALHVALEAQDPRSQGGQDILLVSDGDDPAADGEWTEGAAEAQQRHIPVHTVGVGDPEATSPIPDGGGWLRHDGEVVKTRLEEKPLQEIARRTGGVYIAARTRDLPLGQWFREVIEPQPRPHTDEEEALPVYQQQYAWFFAAALALFALAMLIGSWRIGWSKPCLIAGKVAAATGNRQAPAAVRLAVWLVPLAVGLVSAGPAPQAADLLRQGNAAFEQGQYEAALEQYSRAEESATDPGLVAFNKAAALYRLGPDRYREAELHYRRALEGATGVRRSRALYDLGNCLLQQAQDRDAGLLEEAIRCYRECRRLTAKEAPLSADAAWNLELARQCYFKARSRPEPANKQNSENGDQQPKNGKDKSTPEPGTGTGEQTDPQANQDAKGKQGAEEEQKAGTKTQQTAGRGNLKTLSDADQLVPLAPEDAAAYLERATGRIVRERREHWRSAAPAVHDVKDW